VLKPKTLIVDIGGDKRVSITQYYWDWRRFWITKAKEWVFIIIGCYVFLQILDTIWPKP
jgi:hypothetical protein